MPRTVDSRYSTGSSRTRSRSLGSCICFPPLRFSLPLSLSFSFSLVFSFHSASVALYPSRRRCRRRRRYRHRRFRTLTRLYVDGFAARSFYPSTLSLRKRSTIPHRVGHLSLSCSFFRSFPFLRFSLFLSSSFFFLSFSLPHSHRHARALSLALSRLFYLPARI